VADPYVKFARDASSARQLNDLSAVGAHEPRADALVTLAGVRCIGQTQRRRSIW
jgi:hypothetical protein